VYNRKKSFDDGTREKGDQVTVVQQNATVENESEILGGLDAGTKYHFPGTSIVVKVCGLDSEVTFDFAEVSVYDTSLNQSSNCNIALNTQLPLAQPQENTQEQEQQQQEQQQLLEQQQHPLE
jgi:hypothetical protein